MLGKSLNDIQGIVHADHIKQEAGESLADKLVHYGTLREMEENGERVIRCAYVPLEHIPISTLRYPTPGVLVVEQDVSDVVHEREQRLHIQKQLVQTLITLVDRRDPYAANHSLMVSHIAAEVATEMELDSAVIDAASLAGSLMNIGKIVVPAELLTKTESLTEQEKQAIRDSMYAAADMIRDIQFDGPVADTLRQWQEKWDGSGPLAIKGDDILISARIIAVCNAFVGMISPRSWRTALSVEEANKFLLNQSDVMFDRRVVIALMNYVENHHGRAWIKKILEKQPQS